MGYQQDRMQDSYWETDLSLGEGVCYRYRNKPRPLRLLLHIARLEPYCYWQEIVPITQPEGERIWVHASPYIILPQLPLGLAAKLSWSFKLGFWGSLIRWLTKADWPGMNYRNIGKCQAWYYPQDRLLMLWDCYLYAGKDPRTDHTLCALWHGFERFLLKSFPATERMATRAWESSYDRKDWQAFLTQQGYQPFNPQAFVKKVAPDSLADYHPTRESRLNRWE